MSITELMGKIDREILDLRLKLANDLTDSLKQSSFQPIEGVRKLWEDYEYNVKQLMSDKSTLQYALDVVNRRELKNL